MTCELCPRLALFSIDLQTWCGFTVDFVCPEHLLEYWGRSAEWGEVVLVQDHIEHGIIGNKIAKTEAYRIAQDVEAGVSIGGLPSGPPASTNP